MTDITTTARNMALGGVLAALALVIMCIGTLIPLATYACPVLCMVILHLYFSASGKRLAWVWYTATSILSLLLSPDKEAALLFVVIGYYPIVKQMCDRKRASILYKLLIFNIAIAIMYISLIYLLGIGAVLREFREMGWTMTVCTLLLGNVTFLCLDRLLSVLEKKKIRFWN